MSTNYSQLSVGNFGALFSQLITPRTLDAIARKHRKSSAGAPAKLSTFWLITGMVFHVLQTCGHLSTHIRQVTRKKLSDSTLSERRQVLGLDLFLSILNSVLGTLAKVDTQPRAFYKGFLLTGIDGSCMSVSNAPPIKKSVRKTRSRRGSSAFFRISMAAIYELGTHNPLAASIGITGESEMELAINLLPLMREKWLLIADRYYGVAKFIFALQGLKVEIPCLIRVRKNLKSKLIQRFRDGSCLVEVRDSTGQRIILREIHARVCRRSGRWISVRFWTTLLDPGLYPAKELVELYGMRWEQECAYKELKINLRRESLLLSHTLITAGQEVACLILAQAIVARVRISVADDHAPVLQISFIRTLEIFRALWSLAPFIDNLIPENSWPLLMRNIFGFIVQQQSPPRRNRSCPRAVRKPVSSWPRLRRNSNVSGLFRYEVIRKHA